jgi:hypothetical protein
MDPKCHHKNVGKNMKYSWVLHLELVPKRNVDKKFMKVQTKKVDG